MKYFIDQVGSFISNPLEDVTFGMKLWMYAMLFFGLFMLGLTIILLILKHKFADKRDKDYVDLP